MKRIVLILSIVVFISFTEAFAKEDMGYIEGEEAFNNTVSQLKNGNFNISFENIMSFLTDGLLEEIRKSKGLLISMFVIALMSGALSVMKDADGGTDEAAFFACFSLMAATAAKIIGISVGYGADVINEMSTFVTKLAPIMSILLISGGYASTAAAFYPVFSASVYFICLIVEKVTVPLIYVSCVLGMVNNMSGKLRLDNLSKLIKTSSKWILTFSLTVFSGINAIYGFCTPSVDSLGMKTAKFTVGSMVPVVGGFLSESIETVLYGTRLLKNAAGMAGVISIIGICAVPCIKICAVMIMLKVSAALIEPISDKRYSDLLVEAGEAVTMIFAAVLTVCILFVFSIVIMIATTNFI